MHLYLVTRGIKHDVDRFINDLQGKYLPYEYQKGKMGMLQFGVRPIQLWEMVFPEPQLQIVLNSIKPNNGFSQGMDKYKFLMQKATGSKSIPELDLKAPVFPIFKDNVEMIPIGIKPDRIREAGTGNEGVMGEGCEIL